MSILTDTSGEPKPTSLKKRIIKVQYEPEPTIDEFYNPVPFNIRRPERVQIAQIPTTQIEDVFTEKGEQRKLMAEYEAALEKKKTKQDKKREQEEAFKQRTLFQGVLGFLPTTQQTALIGSLGTAVTTGNYGQLATTLARIQASNAKQEMIKKVRKEKQRKEKPKRKHQKRYRIDAKGNRVLIANKDE